MEPKFTVIETPLKHMLFTVLKTGGEYTEEHAYALHNNFRRIHPAGQVVCISDVTLTSPHAITNTPYPRWWQKMNLFHPALGVFGDIVYADLDTVIVGDMAEFYTVPGDVVLRDFYRGGAAIGSGLMKITPAMRHWVWREWKRLGPETVMAKYDAKGLGDQAFLEEIIGQDSSVLRWQDALPGQVASYKVHIRDAKTQWMRADCRVVCFHGNPRPWKVDLDWVKFARSPLDVGGENVTAH